MNSEARIKLAEAMGWRDCEQNALSIKDGVPTLGPAGMPPPFDKPPYIAPLPDPFTDANDDYACLQHMVEKYGVRETNEILEHRTCAQYFIGAFAKGLLEKLNETG